MSIYAGTRGMRAQLRTSIFVGGPGAGTVKRRYRRTSIVMYIMLQICNRVRGFTNKALKILHMIVALAEMLRLFVRIMR